MCIVVARKSSAIAIAIAVYVQIKVCGISHCPEGVIYQILFTFTRKQPGSFEVFTSQPYITTREVINNLIPVYCRRSCRVFSTPRNAAKDPSSDCNSVKPLPSHLIQQLS